MTADLMIYVIAFSALLAIVAIVGLVYIFLKLMKIIHKGWDHADDC